MPSAVDAILAAVAVALVEEEQRLEDYEARQLVIPRNEYAQRAEFRALRDVGVQRLDRFDRAVRFLTTTGGVKLGYLQKRFLNAIRLVCLPRMLADSLLANLPLLMERYGVRSIEDTVAIVFPRRAGKTIVQCLAAAVIAVSQPDGNIAAFHLFGRQAESWLKQTQGFLELFLQDPEFAWVEVDRHMPERISIRAACAGTVNQISSFPGAQAGSYDNKRGMGFKLFAGFFDEWAFFSVEAPKSLLPIFINGAALIMATSVAMGGARSGTMAILDAVYPDGKRAVLEVNMVQGCSACRAKGEAQRCTHIVARPQHFTRRVHQRRLQALMAPFEGAPFTPCKVLGSRVSF